MHATLHTRRFYREPVNSDDSENKRRKRSNALVFREMHYQLRSRKENMPIARDIRRIRGINSTVSVAVLTDLYPSKKSTLTNVVNNAVGIV